MQWTPQAEAAMRKVPFFVRKKVRARVEADAARAGCRAVDLAQVEDSRRRFLARMDSDVKGYQLDTCFGGDCPNRTVDAGELVRRVEAELKKADLLGFLRSEVDGPLKYHHEFRVSVAECPNACSQPQIKDIGILGARRVTVTAAACSGCESCQEACPDDAVFVADVEAGDQSPSVSVDRDRCLDCGRCAAVCPTGSLHAGPPQYRVMLGGKLGRHPRLAWTLPGLFDADRVVAVVRECLAFYRRRSRGGRRFAQLLDRTTFQELAGRWAPPGSIPEPLREPPMAPETQGRRDKTQ